MSVAIVIIRSAHFFSFLMRSCKRIWLRHGIVLLLVLSSGCVRHTGVQNDTPRQVELPAFAQTIALQTSALDSKLTARAQALAQVHRPLIEEMIALLEVTPAVSQMQLTREQLVTLGSVVVRPEIQDESWDGSTYVLKARLSIVPAKVVERLERLQRHAHRKKVVQGIRARIDRALGAMTQVRQEFASAANPMEGLRLQKAFLHEFHVLSAMQWFTQGLGHANARDDIDAVIAFSAVIELLPQEAEAHHQRALSYLALGQHQQALEDISQALQLSPEEAEYVVVQGLIHEDLNQHQQAIDDFSRALQLDPQRVSAYIGRGRLWEGMQKDEQALADFSRALELAPQTQVAYYNRGTVYSKMGDYERAIADFSRALELNPNDAAALNNRGALYGLLGDYEHSVQDFTRVIALRPQDAKAYFNRATALEKLGDYPQAVQNYSQVLTLDPEYQDAYYLRGRARVEIGAYVEAVQDLNRAIVRQPSRAEAHYSLALAYSMLDRPQDALTHYRVAVQSGLPDLIHEVQKRLKTAGFDPGPLDGVMGPRTESALGQYQKANGLPVTGTLDDPTLQSLFIDAVTTPED